MKNRSRFEKLLVGLLCGSTLGAIARADVSDPAMPPPTSSSTYFATLPTSFSSPVPVASPVTSPFPSPTASPSPSPSPTPAAIPPTYVGPQDYTTKPIPPTYLGSATYTPPPAPPAPPVVAASPPDYASRRRRNRMGLSGNVVPDVWNFRISEIAVFQGSVAQYAPFFSWNPRYIFKGGDYVGLLLGGTSLNNAAGQNFAAISTSFVMGGRVGNSPIGFEGELGVQTWTGLGGTYPIMGANIYYGFDHTIFERIFAGYSAYVMPGFYTSEVKLGIGFSF